MYAIVIDINTSLKKKFVIKNKYELETNEEFIEDGWNIANAMLKPKWTGSKWIETATEEEKKEAEDKIEVKPSETDILKQEIENLKMSIYELTNIIFDNEN